MLMMDLNHKLSKLQFLFETCFSIQLAVENNSNVSLIEIVRLRELRTLIISFQDSNLKIHMLLIVINSKFSSTYFIIIFDLK